MERDETEPEALEIGPAGSERRWVGLVTYVVGFAAVAGVIIVLLRRFTGSLWLAVALVSFMVAYMMLMGWLTARNMSGRS